MVRHHDIWHDDIQSSRCTHPRTKWGSFRVSPRSQQLWAVLHGIYSSQYHTLWPFAPPWHYMLTSHSDRSSCSSSALTSSQCPCKVWGWGCGDLWLLHFIVAGVVPILMVCLGFQKAPPPFMLHKLLPVCVLLTSHPPPPQSLNFAPQVQPPVMCTSCRPPTSQDVQKQDMLRQVKTILGWLPVLLSTMPFPLMHIWPS